MSKLTSKKIGLISLITTIIVSSVICLCCILLIAALAIAASIVMIVFSIPVAPSEEALRLLQGDSMVEVKYISNWWVFSRRNSSKNGGLIFYPGGRIDPRSYAPLLHNITAISGYSCFLTQFPFFTSFFGIFNADFAINELAPNITQWSISGHSLGGTGAGIYVEDVIKNPTANRKKLKGILFYASYSNGDIAKYDGHVLSIYGELDGQLPASQYESSFKYNLPKNRSSVLYINGGNHKQFGSYVQLDPSDNPATISEHEQRFIIANATYYFLNGIWTSN